MSPEALQQAIESLELRVAGSTIGLDEARDNELQASELLANAARLRQEAAVRLERSQEALDALRALQEAPDGAPAPAEAVGASMHDWDTATVVEP